MDKATNNCKGYGFVDFESPQAAAAAVDGLNTEGVQAQMAKLQQQEQDPTNLYIANLPLDFTEQMLETELNKYGMVISTRILRTPDNQSRGVGFARMDSKEKCEVIISALNGGRFETMTKEGPALLIKQADTGRKSKVGARHPSFQQFSSLGGPTAFLSGQVGKVFFLESCPPGDPSSSAFSYFIIPHFKIVFSTPWEIKTCCSACSTHKSTSRTTATIRPPSTISSTTLTRWPRRWAVCTSAVEIHNQTEEETCMEPTCTEDRMPPGREDKPEARVVREATSSSSTI